MATTSWPLQTDQQDRQLWDMSYQAFAPHELPAFHSPLQYPRLHTHAHTNTKTSKDITIHQSANGLTWEEIKLHGAALHAAALHGGHTTHRVGNQMETTDPVFTGFLKGIWIWLLFTWGACLSSACLGLCLLIPQRAVTVRQGQATRRIYRLVSGEDAEGGMLCDMWLMNYWPLFEKCELQTHFYTSN